MTEELWGSEGKTLGDLDTSFQLLRKDAACTVFWVLFPDFPRLVSSE